VRYGPPDVVACKVNNTPKKRLAREHHVARSHVQSAIRRVRTLLNCINHPDPTAA